MIEKINYLKVKYHITSEEISAQSGVPIGTLNKILSGETKNPTGKTAAKIARVFGETAEYLINDDIPIENKNPVTEKNGDEGWNSIRADSKKFKLVQWIAGLDERGLDRIEKILALVEMKSDK